jgi:hypothetical protein
MSAPGDMILVDEGVYAEELRIEKKGLEIMGNGKVVVRTGTQPACCLRCFVFNPFLFVS